MEGSSFDPDRKAKEELKQSTALQDELQAQRDAEREKNKRYALVRTPSRDRDAANGAESLEKEGKSSLKDKDAKKKKKKRNRDG